MSQHPDTQWPRWEIFKQDNAKRPYQAVGSVHAGDPQHALVTARNVFVRRPAAVSLWAVREDDILTVTTQELEQGNWQQNAPAKAETGTYHIGIKKNHKRSMTFVDIVGTVEASSASEAIQQASQLHTEAIAWLVFADSRVARTEQSAETVASWFAPAAEKTYKQQQFYGTVGRHISAYKQNASEARLPPQHSQSQDSKEGLA